MGAIGAATLVITGAAIALVITGVGWSDRRLLFWYDVAPAYKNKVSIYVPLYIFENVSSIDAYIEN